MLLSGTATDLEDLFYVYIGGMDSFARVLLVVAHQVLEHSDYRHLRRERYHSFSSGDGKAFEQGKLGLADLSELARKNGQPILRSGWQELFENIINNYL